MPSRNPSWHYFLLSLLLLIVNSTEAFNQDQDEILDPSYLILTTNSEDPLVIRYRNKECHKCKQLELAEISSSINTTVSIDTYYPNYYLTIIDMTKKKDICADFFTKYITFGENATYLLDISINSTDLSAECTLTELISPPYPLYVPLYAMFGILLGLSIVYMFAKCAYLRSELFKYTTKISSF